MIEIIAMLAGLLLAFIKNRDPKPQREYSHDLEELDKAIRTNDASSIGVLFERLRRESGSHSGGQDGNAFIG